MSETAGHCYWRFIDGRAGHENQSAGLLDALVRRVGGTVHDVPTGAATAITASLPSPTLLVGAGRRTHAPMLGAKAKHGGRAVVLMRPHRREAEFDLCLVPSHDRPLPAPNVLVTEGALNRVRPAADKDENTGLILVGGPSKHHDWLDRELIAQVASITGRDDTRWTVCDSRRTPPRFRSLLAQTCPDLPFVHHADVPAGWLAGEMARSPAIWVSEDSVSMVYEALSAGASVGMLTVPRRRASRVVSGAARLAARGLTTHFLVWERTGQLPPPTAPLAEADRAADWIVEQWLNDR